MKGKERGSEKSEYGIHLMIPLMSYEVISLLIRPRDSFHLYWEMVILSLGLRWRLLWGGVFSDRRLLLGLGMAYGHGNKNVQ